MSISNVQKSEIPRFAGKQFELTKISVEVETSANQNGNNKQTEGSDISKNVSQPNPNSKRYLLRKSQK